MGYYRYIELRESSSYNNASGRESCTNSDGCIFLPFEEADGTLGRAVSRETSHLFWTSSCVFSHSHLTLILIMRICFSC